MSYSKDFNVRLRDLLIQRQLKASPHQMEVVRLLLKEPLTKTQLKQKLKTKKSSVYYIITKFNEKGMIRFLPNLNDMRGHLLTLSEEFVNELTHIPIMHS